AHTLDIQLRTTNTRDTRDTTTLNPTATNPITIYRSHNHYTAHANNTETNNTTTADTTTETTDIVLPPVIQHAITRLTNAGPTHPQNWPTTNNQPTDVDHYYGIPRLSTQKIFAHWNYITAGRINLFPIPPEWTGRSMGLARSFDHIVAWVPGGNPDAIATIRGRIAVKVVTLSQNHAHGTCKPGQAPEVMNRKKRATGSLTRKLPNSNAWASMNAVGNTIDWRVTGNTGSRVIELRDTTGTLRSTRPLDEPVVSRRPIGDISHALPPEIAAALLPVTPSPLTVGSWPTATDGQPADVAFYLGVPRQGGWTTPARFSLIIGSIELDTPRDLIGHNVSFVRKFDTVAMWVPGDKPDSVMAGDKGRQQYHLKRLKPILNEGTGRLGQKLSSHRITGYAGHYTLRIPKEKSQSKTNNEVIRWKVVGDIGGRHIEFYDSDGNLLRNRTRSLDEVQESVGGAVEQSGRKRERSLSP
ncbi:hypothetical protein, partial [Lentzea tibetensis]|uniref:hypothetical protein n=1 Tax=Lentzea tibetensis TaxID=2591470 RepID=UPI00164520A0